MIGTDHFEASVENDCSVAIHNGNIQMMGTDIFKITTISSTRKRHENPKPLN